jgi:hypothetical protein
VQHAAYAAGNQVLAPRAVEIAEALLQLPHVQPLDRLAAEEIGALVARIEALSMRRWISRSPAARAQPPCSTCGCVKAVGWSGGCASSGLHRRRVRSGRRS